jgi:hypothetical protein
MSSCEDDASASTSADAWNHPTFGDRGLRAYAALVRADTVLAMTVDPLVRSFKRPRALGMGLLVLLGTQIVFMAALIAALMHRLQLIEEIRSGQIVPISDADSADNIVEAVGTVEGWIWITTFIVWILWQFRAQRAARELSPTAQFRFTPGWVIGWWFIPIANLWMPFETVRELWKASEGRPDWPHIRTWPIIGWWWGISLASVVVFNVAAASADEPITADGIVARDAWLIVALAIGIASSFLAMAIVRAVRRRADVAAHVYALFLRGDLPPLPQPPV